MTNLAGRGLAAQLQGVADGLGDVREAQREGEVNRIETDVALLAALHIIMVIDGIVALQIIQ